MGVSKLSKLKYSGVERHVESLRKFFVAMAEHIRVVVIKLADRLHNIRTLQFVKPEKQQRIALETLQIHARLADRLGITVGAFPLRLRLLLACCSYSVVLNCFFFSYGYFIVNVV